MRIVVLLFVIASSLIVDVPVPQVVEEISTGSSGASSAAHSGVRLLGPGPLAINSMQAELQ
eukprot:1884579-Amphidinium_carterae.2